MRIGIDIRHLTDPQPAGVGGYTKELLEALFRLDSTNEYILFASGTRQTLKGLPQFNFPKVRLVTLPIPNKLVTLLIMLGARLESLLNVLGNTKSKIDCWFFPNHNFIRTRLPYVVMVHDLSYEIFPEFFPLKSRLRHRLARQLVKRARVVLCPSQSTKQDLTELYGIDEAKVCITPLASKYEYRNLNIESIKKSEIRNPAFNIKRRFILALATLEPRKNHRSIIEAYEAYRDETGDNITLVIGGGSGWKSSALKRATKRSKYAQQIHLLGYVDEQQKTSLFTQAQLFVFPSFYEGFGLPVLEAMAAGCPVIVSHSSSLPELVGAAGILIDPYNVNDLTVAIKQVLNSESLRQMLCAKGRLRAEAFSWERTAQQTLEALSKNSNHSTTAPLPEASASSGSSVVMISP